MEDEEIQNYKTSFLDPFLPCQGAGGRSLRMGVRGG